MLYFSYQTYSSQKKNSAFVIYGRAFIENINNNRKLLCFLGKHHNLEFLEFELRDYKSYSRSPSYVKCEMKPDEYIKAFTLNTFVKMYIQVCLFSKVSKIA